MQINSFSLLQVIIAEARNLGTKFPRDNEKNYIVRLVEASSADKVLLVPARLLCFHSIPNVVKTLIRPSVSKVLAASQISRNETRTTTALTKHPLEINFIDVIRSFDGLHAITHEIRYQHCVVT